jgi:hypothetical protein
MNSKAEKRKYPRHPALYTAKYTIRTGTYRDLIANVSAGGIYVHSHRDVERGQRISLRFPIIAFDKRPNVMGTVVRSHDQGFAVMFDDPIEERIPKRVPF